MVSKIIAFHTDQLSERGTEIALFDYAYFNEKMFGNKSIIFYQENNLNSNEKVIQRFKNTFECYSYNEFCEIDNYIKKLNIHYFYNIKNDRLNKGQRVNGCINLNHAVFELEPHGDVYASISQDLCDIFKINVPVVPHMINIQKHDENMRSILNIPENAIVFGRYGGFYEFDITDAYYAIAEILDRRQDVYFIFANTRIFYNHPRILYLDTIIDLNEKTKFINTCNAMIHARSYGESFGLAIGEFSTLNKPVITTFGKYNAHIKILADKGIIFRSKDELLNIFMNIEKIIKLRDDWNAYKDYTPEIVMKQFMKVFINDKPLSNAVNISNLSKKIVVLIIYNEKDSYNEMKKMNDEYLLFLEKNSQIMKYVNVFYITFKNLNGQEYLIDGNILYIHGEETFLPGVLNKTLDAMKVITNNLNIQYDFILRSNASTVINYYSFFRYIEELNICKKFAYIGPFSVLNWLDPKCGFVDNTYFGSTYCEGTFILMNKELVINMIENREKILISIIDDVSIGRYVSTLDDVQNICIKDKMCLNYAYRNNDHVNKIAYYNNQNKLNRQIDINNFKEEIQIICKTYEKQYSIVIPIRPNTCIDQCKTYFNLLNKYLHFPDVYRIYVITSKEFIEAMKYHISDVNICSKINFINEVTLQNMNELPNVQMKNWYYQQLLKLKIAQLIKTNHYLILDIDMFLIKPLKYEDMFFENKIIYTHEYFPHNNPPGYTNRSWWENSCNLLNISIEKLYDMKNLMGVTPQLLITNVVNELISFLIQKFGLEWEKVLIQHGFTEFSLYWIYILERNLDKLYTVLGKPLLDVDENVSILHSISHENIIKTVKNALNLKKYHFLLVQGWLNIDFSIYSYLLPTNNISHLDLQNNNQNNSITLVTAFFDIDRGNYQKYSRTTDDYLKAFFNYLDMDYKMIVFIDDRHINKVVSYYENSRYKNKIFIPINELWLKNNIYAWKQIDKDKEIMSSDFYKTLLKNRISMKYPENIYSEYNIINHSKIDFINYAIYNNYIEDEYVFWSDFGYYHSILDNKCSFFPTNVLDVKKINKRKINCFMLNKVLPEDRNISFIALNGKVNITGTFYGGSVSIMKKFQDLYHNSLQELYSHNISDDDQHVLLRCYFNDPELFQLYEDEKHPIWPRGLNYFQITE